MRSGFVSNGGLDVVVTSIVYAFALGIALLIREAARARVGDMTGDRIPRLAGRSSPGREIFDPLGSVFFPLFTAVTGVTSYAWAQPLSYDLGRPGRPSVVIPGAVAGSAANIVVALISARLLSPLTGSILAGRFLGLFITANVTMAVMHLLPIPPLDGARVVASFLSPQQRGTMLRFEPFGIAVLFGLAFLGQFTRDWPFAGLVAALRRLVA